MTCCEPSIPPSGRTYRKHLRGNSTPCQQSRDDMAAYRRSLPPRPPRTGQARASRAADAPSPRSVPDPSDYADATSDVREQLRERAAAVQWLEDTFTAEEAALYLRRMARS